MQLHTYSGFDERERERERERELHRSCSHVKHYNLP